MATLRHEADRKGVEHFTICQRYGKKKLDELTVLDFKKAMSGLSKMPDKALEDFNAGYEQYEIFEDLPFQ